MRRTRGPGTSDGARRTSRGQVLARDRSGALRRVAGGGGLERGSLDAPARAPAGQEGSHADGGLPGPWWRGGNVSRESGSATVIAGGRRFGNHQNDPSRAVPFSVG